MKKISNSSPQHNPTSRQGCFSNIFQNFVCAGNLPTHPTLPDQKFPEKSDKFSTFSDQKSNNVPYNIIEVKSRVQSRTRDQTQTRTRTQTQDSPGIIAKLMGLETLPPSNNDFLFRSKSLNALHFMPDFDPTRAAFQHRRTRTSASFHEQDHGNSRFLAAIDENLEHNDGLRNKESDKGRRDSKQRKENKEKGVVSKKNEQHRRRKKDRSYKRYDHEEGYASNCDSEIKLKCNNVGGASKNNLRNKNAMQKRKIEVNNKEIRKVNVVGPSKRRVDHKKEDLNVELQNDGLSRSPVSVLDHQQGLFDSPTKDESRQVTSSSRRKSSPKNKIYDDMPSQEMITKSKKNDHESNKIGSKGKLRKASEGEMADYFVELLGQICKLTEENVKDSKWMGEYEGCKADFMEEICVDIGEEMLDFLLNELMDELVE